MKDIIENKSLSTNSEELVTYSDKTKHLFSKSDQKFFETLPHKMPTSAKYLDSQKRMVIKKTKKIYVKDSSLPLKRVIIEMLSTLPDFLTAENLLKVVGYITKTWEECQAKKAEETAIPVNHPTQQV
ncbi:MAG: hypothetical protein AB8G86_03710 [Saprospiraceae bacterium]